MAWSEAVRTRNVRGLPGPIPWPAVVVGTVVQLGGVEALAGLHLIDRLGAAVALLTYGVGAGLVAVHRRAAALGWANALTMGRLLGVSWIAGLTAGAAGGTDTATRNLAAVVAMVAVGTLCLILDGADGKVARARGEVGAFGARFDMETDAAMLMVLSLAVALHGFTGWWVVAIGLMRYIYWAASAWMARLQITLPFSFARKVVAAVQGIALLVSLAVGASGLFPSWLPSIAAGLALAALTWSFGRDVAWQLTR
jgi:phosphatidylglycerophosphate synthase